VRCRDIDLTRIDDLRAYLATAEPDPVRIVASCAGVGYAGHTLNCPLNDFLAMGNINAAAVLVLSYHFAGAFAGRKVAGAIINVSTANVEALVPTPFSAVYTSLKSFVKFFTESLAFEMSPYGVDVINVSCGPTATGFQGHAGTRRLPWSESAESVAIKALNGLGQRTTIITNPVSRTIVFAARHLPIPRRLKIRLAAAYFGNLLGQGQRLTLDRSG
jgi:short-subunit dehydrogenase